MMPDPPHVGLVTRHVLENPYPLGLVLVALAAGFAWTAVRGERPRRLRPAGVLAALGAAALVTGAVVVTAGERATEVTRRLVEAAVAGDVKSAGALFADEAALAFGAPTNPARTRASIQDRVDNLDGKYRVAENRITKLRSYTESRRRATVHLACLTTLEGRFGPTPTQWVLRVECLDDGSWKITHVTWVSIAGQTPSSGMGL